MRRLPRGVLSAVLAAGLPLTLAFAGAFTGAPPGSPASAGEAETTILPLNDGGQFVFWQFGPAQAGDVFAGEAGGGASTIKIAWLFNTGTVDWTSFIPALGATNFTLADGDVLWVVSEGQQKIPIDGEGPAPGVEFDFKPASQEEIQALVEPFLGAGESVLSSYFGQFAFEGLEGADNIIALVEGDTDLSIVVFDRIGELGVRLSPIESFAFFEFVDVLFIDVDGDTDAEVIVLATYITSIGPTGAVPFQSNSVLDWDGFEIIHLPAVEDVVRDLESADAVRDALGVK